ncbi:hypothetical protein ACFWFF_01345 [Streptomyces sp. NPDC060223]|uniref:hypothetical protein n=1 Tax=unclassified Streptomyces TaxID=2593676 RepID=UPI003640F592
MTTQITGPENTTGDLVAPNGKVWRVTQHTRNGAALYVIDGVDPEKCPRLVMSTRMELEEIFGAELLPLGGAA